MNIMPVYALVVFMTHIQQSMPVTPPKLASLLISHFECPWDTLKNTRSIIPFTDALENMSFSNMYLLYAYFLGNVSPINASWKRIKIHVWGAHLQNRRLGKLINPLPQGMLSPFFCKHLNSSRYKPWDIIEHWIYKNMSWAHEKSKISVNLCILTVSVQCIHFTTGTFLAEYTDDKTLMSSKILLHMF